MSKLKDLTGQTFGYLRVIKQFGKNKQGNYTWLCKCLNCYNFTIVSGGRLTSNHTKSCGCYHREQIIKINKKDLTGMIFGRLAVLCECGKNKYGNYMYLCQCKCGNYKFVKGSNLTSGHTKSCGCYQKERASETSKKDLTGLKFGRLTVIKKDSIDNNGNYKWLCQCSCGNQTIVSGSNLIRGNTQSCGCLQKEIASGHSKINITGQKFGRLTVVKDNGRDNHRSIMWLCQCDCGNKITVSSHSLFRGLTQSCGCLHKERVSELHRGANNFNWKGGITPLNSQIRVNPKYIEWRTAIFERDNYTCQCCKKRGCKLHVHHIKRFAVILEANNITTLEEALNCDELWNINNGIILCEKCHKEIHNKVGRN